MRILAIALAGVAAAYLLGAAFAHADTFSPYGNTGPYRGFECRHMQDGTKVCKRPEDWATLEKRQREARDQYNREWKAFSSK